jgi:hypothetical protein
VAVAVRLVALEVSGLEHLLELVRETTSALPLTLSRQRVLVAADPFEQPRRNHLLPVVRQDIIPGAEELAQVGWGELLPEALAAIQYITCKTPSRQ